MATMLLPPGVTREGAESALIADLGFFALAYFPSTTTGGIWIHETRRWELWYPVEQEEFGKLARQFLQQAGKEKEAIKALDEATKAIDNLRSMH